MNLEPTFGPVIDAMPHEQRLALLPEGCIIRRLLERDRSAYRGELVRQQLREALYREQQGQVAVAEVDYPPMWEPDELPEEF